MAAHRAGEQEEGAQANAEDGGPAMGADGGGGVHGDSRTADTVCIEDRSGDPVDELTAAACPSSRRSIRLSGERNKHLLSLG